MLDTSTVDRVIADAMNCVNEAFDYNFSCENTILRLYTTENALELFEVFILKYRFKHEKVDEDYFQNTDREAFAYGKLEEKDINGILIKAKDDLTVGELFHTMIHELCHIYFRREEIEGGHFYEQYCLEPFTTGNVDENILNGYEIWMEFIAEYYAMQLAPEFDYYNYMYDYVEQIEESFKNVQIGDPSVKYSLSFWLAAIMDTKEARCDGWARIEEILSEIEFPFVSLAKQIYEHIQDDIAYKITSDFIYEIGACYMDGILKIRFTAISKIGT